MRRSDSSIADNLARAQLARQALRLAQQSRSGLPPLIFLTDDSRVADPLCAIRALPRGSLVILRSRDPARRRALARVLPAVAAATGLRWTVADDAMLASEARADGVHFSERAMARAMRWRARRPRWLITAAAHSLRASLNAASYGVNAVLLAPVFRTESHPGRPHLGSLRARIVANSVPVPVYALGGVDAQTARRLVDARLAGLAAIGALSGVPRGRCTPATGTV